MNILILISSLNFGGAEKQAVIDANFLADDHNVFFGFYKDGDLKDQVSSKVNLIKIKKSNYIATAIRIAKIIRENDIQVIHASLFAPMILSALATFFTGTKVIWNFHSHEYDLPAKSYFAFNLLSKSRNVKKIVFVNNELIGHFRARGFIFPRSKIELLYNSTDFDQIPKRSGNNCNKIIIGYVGRLVELKRVAYLLELAKYLISKEMRNFEIQIIGDGEEREKLEEYVQIHQLMDYIRFFGFQSIMEKFYSNFDLFISPSGEECLSIALIDTGISGVPAIAFKTGGNDEIIKDQITGYIVTSKEELFEKSALLLQNSELRTRMGEEAANYCKDKFSQENRKRELIRIFVE